MVSLFAMLIAALVPTGHPSWMANMYSSPAPARCFYDWSRDRYGSGYAYSTDGRQMQLSVLSWTVGIISIGRNRLLGPLQPPLGLDEFHLECPFVDLLF